MIYWVLKETLGYSYGVVTDKENVPAGAEIVESEGEQKDLVAKLETELNKELNDFFIDGPAKIEAELAKEEEKEKPKEEDKKVPPGQEKKDLNQVERRNNG